MSCTVKIVTLGCPKNIVDSRQMKGCLLNEGFSITDNTSDADVIVINTCGFIEDAKRESIATILEMLEWKERGRCRFIIAAGCLAQKYADEIAREIPEIDAVIGTGDLPRLIDTIKKLDTGERINCVGDPNSFLYNSKWAQYQCETGHYAYVKIAEGCDNACSYCVIPAMRGSYRSRSIEDIVFEAENLAEQGVKELILVAQDTTLYGYDIYKHLELPKLLRELVKISGIRWIRLLYSYPSNITDELLYTIKSEDKICSYLDIPLQHISDRVLERMGRPINQQETKALISKIKYIIPDIVLRSTFIVGFPGEKEEDFNELLSFINEYKFDRAGFFAYSKEPGTKAAKLDQQINKQLKIKRLERALAVQSEVLSTKQAAKIGHELIIIVDGPSNDYEGLWEGRTQGDAPEIDGVVYFKPQTGVVPGMFKSVRVTHSQEFALMGEIIDESC